MNITKDELLQRVRHSLLFEKKPIECPYDLLRFPFGFKRVSGEAFMFAQLIRPSITEESMSYAPKRQIIQNVLDWAKENGFVCFYNGDTSMADPFTFRGLLNQLTLIHNLRKLRFF
jgi:hypothetical protein